MQKAVHFVNNPKEIQMLANCIHNEILQLLSERPMTETELSEILSHSKAVVGYHLKLLKQANLIYINRVEAEAHGILQKFYSSIANFMIVEYDRTPDEIKRFFIQLQIDHLTGMLAALKLQYQFSDISPETIEELAIILWKQLEKTCKKYEGKKAVESSINLKISIYTDALNIITTLREWRDLYK